VPIKGREEHTFVVNKLLKIAVRLAGRRVVSVFSLMVLSGGSTASDAPACTPAAAGHVESNFASIKGWPEVYKEFITKHVSDETIPENVLSAIRQHAQRECPSGLERLCKELATAAK
jgi:hypothetical protein